MRNLYNILLDSEKNYLKTKKSLVNISRYSCSLLIDQLFMESKVIKKKSEITKELYEYIIKRITKVYQG